MWWQIGVQLRNESLLIKTQHLFEFLKKVATTKHLSPQLWRMWQQREYGWTPLIYMVSTFCFQFVLSLCKLLNSCLINLSNFNYPTDQEIQINIKIFPITNILQQIYRFPSLFEGLGSKNIWMWITKPRIASPLLLHKLGVRFHQIRCE
jgi:hypothetical protein